MTWNVSPTGAQSMARKAALAAMVLLIGMCGRAFAQLPSGQWFKGDLHAHSLYSDGDSTVSEVLASAESKGLDFFTITDHDTSVDGVIAHWYDPTYTSDSMALLYGVEWNTGQGHANVWAATDFNYSDLWEANRSQSAEAAVAAAHLENALFSINHPSNILGLSWQYSVTSDLDCIEVWNSMFALPEANSAAIEMWDGIVATGRRVTAVGGSDTHELRSWQEDLFTHGNPTIWVFAGEKQSAAVLNGIKEGHVSLSYAPNAVRLNLVADLNGDGKSDCMIGDNVSYFPSSTKFTVTLDGAPGGGKMLKVSDRCVRHFLEGKLDIWDILPLTYLLTQVGEDTQTLMLHKNGALSKVWLLSGGASKATFSDQPAEGDWYRLELRGKPDVDGLQVLLYGRMLALTNPIYFGFSE